MPGPCRELLKNERDVPPLGQVTGVHEQHLVVTQPQFAPQVTGGASTSHLCRIVDHHQRPRDPVVAGVPVSDLVVDGGHHLAATDETGLHLLGEGLLHPGHGGGAGLEFVGVVDQRDLRPFCERPRQGQRPDGVRTDDGDVGVAVAPVDLLEPAPDLLEPAHEGVVFRGGGTDPVDHDAGLYRLQTGTFVHLQAHQPDLNAEVRCHQAARHPHQPGLVVHGRLVEMQGETHFGYQPLLRSTLTPFRRNCTKP